jgi:hypothetical protein
MFAFIQNLSNETNVLHISDYRANVIKNRDKLYTISEVAIEEYQILADEGLEYVKSIKRIGISPVRPIIIDDSLYVAGKNNNSENIIKVIDISNDEMQFVRDINLGVGEAIAEIHNYGRYLIYTQYVSIINHVFDLDTNQEVTQYNFGAYNAIKDSLMFTLWISDETEISIENISDIYNPIHISLVSFPQMDFVVKYLFKDNYLFAVGNDKIAILDISDINNPTLVSFIDNIPYTLSDVEIFTGAKIVNNYLIFNDMRNYLWIYDISDLNSPQFVHNYSTMFDGFHYRDNFTIDNNGSTSIDVYLNFDRNVSNPVNPFELNITTIEVNDSEANGSKKLGKIAKYYYGNLLLDDIVTSKNPVKKTFNFVIYDARNDNLQPDNVKELKYYWYENLYHQNIDGNITQNEINITKGYSLTDEKINSITVTPSIGSGELNMTIDKGSYTGNFAVIHLLSPNLKWLWYSKFGNEYNISNGSSCLNHFCFTITWQKIDSAREVGSGTFAGTESNVTETNSTKRGVKIFR